ERNFVAFLRGLGRLAPAVPYLTVIGNHDRRFPHGFCDAHLYRSAFGKTNYHFDRGAARFVSVDTSLMRVTARQLAWLDRVLDTPKRKIVFAHIPPAHLGPWTHYGRAKGVGGFRAGAQAFTSLMSRRAVDRVYFGHIHAFGVQDYEGVRYVLTGGGGSPLFPCGVQDRFHHYLVATVGPDGVRETVHTTDGGAVAVPAAPILLSR
ncbi:MAG TPA: metallophosphoesterase, partial [Elusimicrobiota bacterium]|nr:metallophosphoesterase [Elusimicrobiota bacterium]